MTAEKILIVNGERSTRSMLSKALNDWSYNAVHANNTRSALKVFDNEQPFLTLLDINLPDGSGLKTLQAIKTRQTDAVVIMIADEVLADTITAGLNAGACDFVTKPINLDKLQIILDSCLENKNNSQNLPQTESSAVYSSFGSVIGESSVMKELLSLAQKVAENHVSSVLLQGESGTGKDLIAKAIHYSSPRSAKPFVAINCAAIPAHLIESELFGYEKGAFTDAKTLKEGLFEQADGGTIFLDEIGELELGLQAKLLRVLEENNFRRVGGLKDLPLKACVIAASNRNLREAGKDGNFRQDLYFRLSVIEIDIPPLRARDDDVLLLAAHFIKTLDRSRFRSKTRQLSPDVIKAFKQYPWYGNVRELRNVIERVLILEEDEQITLKYLPPPLINPDYVADQIIEADTDQYFQLPPLGISLDAVESSLIEQALKRSRGNVTRAAETLHISRDRLRYYLKTKRLS